MTEDLATEMRMFSMNMRRDAADAHNPDLLPYADAIGQFAEAVAVDQLRWQELRDLFGLDGWHDGTWAGIPNPDQIVTHVKFVASERARLLHAELSSRRADTVEAAEVVTADERAELAEYRRRAELNPLSGMSWGGFNVWGDDKSMTEVKAAVHSHGQIEEFRTLLRHQREELGKLHANVRTSAATIESLSSQVEGLKVERDELEARAISLLWLVPPDKTVGELQALKKRAADLLALQASIDDDEWEYATREGPRKSWYDADVPPDGEGWERDTSQGDNGFERFDAHEESYWKRRKPARAEKKEPTEAWLPRATAPRDGTSVLVSIRNSVFRGRWWGGLIWSVDGLVRTEHTEIDGWKPLPLAAIPAAPEVNK